MKDVEFMTAVEKELTLKAWKTFLKHGLNPSIAQCFFCGKDKNEILLLGAAYKEEAPMHMCFNHEPCDECKKLMEMGVLLISVRNGENAINPKKRD